MRSSSVDTKKRWGIKDEPNWQRFFMKREVVHPIINNWNEICEYDKELLLDVKSTIVSYMGECKLGFGGSRIKGYWNDDSDYDVKVNKLPDSEQKAKIASHPWKYRVDISFCSPEHFEKENVIEIP